MTDNNADLSHIKSVFRCVHSKKSIKTNILSVHNNNISLWLQSVVLWAKLGPHPFRWSMLLFTTYFVIETNRNVYNLVLKCLYNTVIQDNEEPIIILERILNEYEK